MEINDKAIQFLGWNKEEVVAKKSDILIPLEHQENEKTVGISFFKYLVGGCDSVDCFSLLDSDVGNDSR